MILQKLFPFLPGNRVGIRDGVLRIGVFLDFLHSVSQGCGIRTHVCVFHVGVKDIIFRVTESPVPDSPGGFLRETATPVLFMNMITDFRQDFTIYILEGDSAVSDELTGFLQDNCPETETVFFIVIQIPGDPVSGLSSS